MASQVRRPARARASSALVPNQFVQGTIRLTGRALGADLALTILPSALGEQLHVVLLTSSRRWRAFYARHKEPLLLVSWALDVRSLVALSECHASW